MTASTAKLAQTIKYEFVPHRILELEKDDIAIISELSTAWTVLKKEDYRALKKYLQENELSLEAAQKPLIKKLYNGGVLLKNNQPLPLSQPKTQDTPSSLLLKLTGACNIDCTYCYDFEEKRWKTRLDAQKIKSTIDYLLERRDTLGIVFHGGEPLLRFKLLKEIVHYVHTKAKDINKIKFSIQTNGELLDAEKIDFLKKHNFSVGLSIDGHTETSNRLRIKKNNKGTALNAFLNLVNNHFDFLQNHCGVLAVVSKANINELPDFALWLENKGLNNLGLSFMDAIGKGKEIAHEVVTPQEAVGLYSKFCELIESEKIKNLKISALSSKIANLFQFQPKDFCFKGPCAANKEFLVLDSEGKYRTCDAIYHPFFLIGDELGGEKEKEKRQDVLKRYEWLKTNSMDCKNCAVLSLCGGTCPAKAMAASLDPYSISRVECALSKYLYPKLLKEFAYNKDKPLINYYLRHKSA